MSLSSFAAAWAGTAISFLALDSIWLSQMGPRLYRPALETILATKPNWRAATAFYLLYVTGIVLIAVAPALSDRDLSAAITHGALLGLIAYGAYDLTNQATLKSWSTRLSVIDMTWGVFVTGAAAAAGFGAGMHIG